MRKLLAILFIFLPLMSFAAPGSVMQSGNFIGVYQFVGLPSGGYVNSFIAKVGKVRFEDDTGSSMSHKGKTLEIGGAITALPYATFNEASPPLQSVLRKTISDYQYQATTGTFLNDLKSFMRKNGASTLSYTYRQQIKVQGNPNTKSIIWRVIIDLNGRPRYAAPRVISDVPAFVYLNYFPKAVADGLPATFAYPNSGNYSWQLVKKDMSPLTSAVFVNTNGAFDAPRAATPPSAQPAGCSVGGLNDPDSPTDQTEPFCDPDYGLKCLINEKSNASCTTTYKDVVELMDEVGADGAFVDYNREIEPVYKVVCPSGATFNDQEGTCSDGSEPEERAVAAMDVPFRKISQSSCLPDAIYENKINIGYQIRKQADRYGVQLDASYQQIGTGVSEEASPNQTYNPIIALPVIPADISSNIIDPFELKLSNISNYLNIVNLAAITREYTGTSSYSFYSAYPAVDYYGDITQKEWVDVQCAGGLITVTYRGVNGSFSTGDSIQFVIGVPATKSTSAYNGAAKRVLMDRSSTFQYNGNDRITLTASPGWDGVNDQDGRNSFSPPPSGLAKCAIAGATVFHNYTKGGSVCNGIAGCTNTARVSELLCSNPPTKYGSCPSTLAMGCTTSYGVTSCTNLPFKSQTSTTCTYKGTGYPTNYPDQTVSKPITCPAGTTNNGAGKCTSKPAFYINLTK